MLERLIRMQPSWLPTLLLVPLLYLCGWVLALPLVVIGLPAQQHSLVGTLISVLLLLILLPQWCRLRWNSSSCWRSLGILSLIHI